MQFCPLVNSKSLLIFWRLPTWILNNMSKIYIKPIRMFENITCFLRKPYGEKCDPNNTIDLFDIQPHNRRLTIMYESQTLLNKTLNISLNEHKQSLA